MGIFATAVAKDHGAKKVLVIGAPALRLEVTKRMGADDVLNFLPARLTAALMVPAAALLGLNWRETWRLARRDAGKTKSPNAGWPEAALAGALGVQLAGPSTYFGQTVDKAWLGDPGPPLTARHYTLAVRLLYATSLLMAGITLGLLK